MRQITSVGLNLIKQFEGFEGEVYLDAVGLPTIGYGHLLTKQELADGTFENGISRLEAEHLLRKDVRFAERAVLRLIRVPLLDGQFDALVSFTFNLGSGSLQRSTLRRKLNRYEYDAIPNELMRWVNAGGRKLKGLVRRRRAEAILFLGP
jgi:lysozyme